MKEKEKKPEHLLHALGMRQLLLGLGVLGLMAVLLVVGLTPETALAPDQDSPATQVDSGSAVTLAEGCQVVQEMTFAPCGHTLTRRQALPQELLGKGRGEVEAVYDLWQITSFAPMEVTMEQTLEMYCPKHQVLMPDASGVLCIFENRYGDALALVRSLDIPLSTLPAALQEELREGMGFDTLEDLERYLENVES